MQKQYDRFSGIFHLLWEGKTKEAKNTVSNERAVLLRRKTAITEELADIDKDLGLLDTILPPEVGLVPPPPSAPSLHRVGIISSAMIDKDKRDSAIIETAKELGYIADTFYTVDVGKAVTQKGIDMGIPENRYSSVISRLLLNHEDQFLKVDSGTFRLKNA